MVAKGPLNGKYITKNARGTFTIIFKVFRLILKIITSYFYTYKLRERNDMKISRESKPEFIFGAFSRYRFTMKTWKNKADVFKFQSISTLTTKARDDNKEFRCSTNTVFSNKTKPLFVGQH